MLRLAHACRAHPGQQIRLVRLPASELADLERWGALLGHAVVGTEQLDDELTVTLRVAPPALDSQGAIPSGEPATMPQSSMHQLHDRLWIYTNFDCNLACNYCCVRSSPKALRRVLGLDTIRGAAEQAGSLAVKEILLTGGEPFLRADIADVVSACSQKLPTTVLTNGMLFRGARRRALEAMSRSQVTLQISIDSVDETIHDQNRGAGTWQKALDGVEIARDLGFRVRVAATITHSQQDEAVLRLFDQLTLPKEDRVVRPMVSRGFGSGSDGLPLARSELVPEVTLTDRGVYFHPVGADDPDFFVTDRLLPLAAAFEAVQQRMEMDQAYGERVRSVFQCA